MPIDESTYHAHTGNANRHGGRQAWWARREARHSVGVIAERRRGGRGWRAMGGSAHSRRCPRRRASRRPPPCSEWRTRGAPTFGSGQAHRLRLCRGRGSGAAAGCHGCTGRAVGAHLEARWRRQHPVEPVDEGCRPAHHLREARRVVWHAPSTLPHAALNVRAAPLVLAVWAPRAVRVPPACQAERRVEGIAVVLGAPREAGQLARAAAHGGRVGAEEAADLQHAPVVVRKVQRARGGVLHLFVQREADHLVGRHVAERVVAAHAQPAKTAGGVAHVEGVFAKE
eukprot:6469682-Prymnesium_polylepis.1